MGSLVTHKPFSPGYKESVKHQEINSAARINVFCLWSCLEKFSPKVGDFHSTDSETLKKHHNY